MAALSLSVVIPIHNESALLADAIADMLVPLRAFGQPFEIVLVENGSTDATAAVARQLGRTIPEIRVLELPGANYGKALRAGMETARGEVIVNFDIDYWDIPFLEDAWALTRRRFHIVIGSKNLLLSSDRRGFVRRWVSQVFSLVLRLVFGLRVSDTHGIKVWKHSPLLEQLIAQVRFDHHLFDTELILRAQRAGLHIVELPVEVSETRQPPWGIVRRIPRALWDIICLRVLLWREASRRRG